MPIFFFAKYFAELALPPPALCQSHQHNETPRLAIRITYEAVKNLDSRMNKAGLRTVNLPYSPATKDPPKETADPDAVFPSDSRRAIRRDLPALDRRH